MSQVKIVGKVSLEIKNRITELRQSGCTYNQICDRLGVSKTLVWRVTKDELTTVNRKDIPFHLSNRELDVARLLVEGKNIKCISESLKIKTKTTDSHIGNIYKKLGLVNNPDTCSRTIAVITLKDVI